MVNERLLLVDDEPPLLDLLKKYLERLGYAVDAATHADEALKLFGANPAAYRLVVTDLTLEGMNGAEMIERMRELAPALPAIISSGYPYQPTSSETQFLQKPYIPKMLAEAIARIFKPAQPSC